MKTKLVLAIAGIITLCSFVLSKKEEAFTVDTESSSIEWVAGKVGGEHSGVIKLSSGTLGFDGNNLKSGSFTIDMTTMAVTDIKGNSAQNLLNHLKSDDFFSVAKNPSATFQVTKVASTGADRVQISGNLTIKGISNAISFPASVKKQKNVVVAVANGVKVDRTKYDIKYRSKSFFGDIGDKAIDDEFTLNIKLAAKK